MIQKRAALEHDIARGGQEVVIPNEPHAGRLSNGEIASRGDGRAALKLEKPIVFQVSGACNIQRASGKLGP